LAGIAAGSREGSTGSDIRGFDDRRLHFGSFVREDGALMSVFDDMTVFVRAVEVGSFSGAAQQLGIAKSIVSRRILSLESRLGTSMFHRSTRRLSLTETGLAYYERARRILADVAEAEDVASQLHGELKGRLKVALPMSFGYRHLSPVVTDFLRAHPQVDIELDLNDRRVDLISEGFDIAVRIGSLPDSSIISRTLAPCRHVVCASPAYLAISHKRPPNSLLKTIFV
jgi:DNA-binding transcriptional LysR family regulator